METYVFTGDKKELKKQGYTYFGGGGNGSRYYKILENHVSGIFIFNKGNMLIYEAVNRNILVNLIDYIKSENPDENLFISDKGTVITSKRRDEIDESFHQEMLDIEKQFDDGKITKEEEKVLIVAFFTKMKENEYKIGIYIHLSVINQIKELVELGIEKITI